MGAFIASGIYRIFTHVYSVPSDQFPIPLAHMGANTARLVGGGDLPNGVGPVVLGVFILSASLRILSLVAGNKHWKAWVPSAVAMSIGKIAFYALIILAQLSLPCHRHVHPTIHNAGEPRWSGFASLF